MGTVITRIYHFESGHYLPYVPDGHMCKRQHGHNYKMEVSVRGTPNPTGFLIDFWDLDTLVTPLLKKVDHYNLNDIKGLENPTAELIARWFFEPLATSLQVFGLQLDSVTIWETPDCCARVDERKEV